MKKIFTMLMVVSMFGLVACGSSAEEKAKAEAEAEAMVEKLFENLDEAMEEVPEEMELAEHVCGTQCEEKGCSDSRCGEAGYECSDACHAGKEEHIHTEGEAHKH